MFDRGNSKWLPVINVVVAVGNPNDVAVVIVFAEHVIGNVVSFKTSFDCVIGIGFGLGTTVSGATNKLLIKYFNNNKLNIS